MSGDVYVVEYTDPQCVWAWSSEPRLRWLRARYGAQLHWRRVFGVQVDDLSLTHPYEDPAVSAEAFRASWIEVAGHTGAPIARAIDWSSSSSRRASLTAKAAELQGPEIAERVLRRLREAVFVAGRPVDTPSRIADALVGVPALDLPQLLAAATSARVRAAIRADVEETRHPDPDVIDLVHASPHSGAARPAGERLRYAFPTLIISGPQGRRIVPGWRTAETYDDAVRAVSRDATPSQQPPISASEALERYRSLSLADLELLTGSQLPPLEAVPIVTATTPLFVHPDDVEQGQFARLGRELSLTR
jgi:predicted DsbA family dithiol-disulfide isomerase